MISKRTFELVCLIWLTGSCFAAIAAAADAPDDAQVADTAKTTDAGFAAIPVRTIASLMQDSVGADSGASVHVQGTVLEERPGEYIVVGDETGTIFAETYVPVLPKVKERVDVYGTLSHDGARIYLEDATFRLLDAEITLPQDSTATKPTELPLLTKAWEVRDLSVERAGWQYPIRLRGVVTVSAGLDSAFFVQDETSGIYIRMKPARAGLKPGDLVQVEGFSDPGGFAPIVIATNVSVVGNSPLPEPRQVTLFQLATGQDGSQWIEVRGVVRSISYKNGVAQLKLSDPSGTLPVNFPATSEPTNLLDAVVRIQGACGTEANSRRQLTGLQMWASSPDNVQIEEPGVADPLGQPVKPIISLSQFRPRQTLQRRVTVSGVVTLCQSSQSIFIQDASDGVQVLMSQKSTLQAGDRVLVAGYPALGDYGSVLREAIVRVTDHGSLPEPKPLALERALDPQLHDRLVEVKARFLGRSRIGRMDVMTLQLGDRVFEARCVASSPTSGRLPEGSLLRLTGVYRIMADEARNPSSFQLLVPSTAAIQVMERPSWWNFQHTLTAVGIMALLVAASILWVMVLRRQITEQTATLQQSESKFRSLVEQSLVGVYIIQDGRFTYVNPRLAEIFGRTSEEMLKLSLVEVIFKDDLALVHEQIQLRMAGDQNMNHHNFRGQRKDGSIVFLEVLGSRTTYNNKPAIVGTLLDVSERRSAEEALAQASSLLETMLENAPDFIYFKDRDSKFVRASKSLASIFHLSGSDDLKGKSDFDFFLEEHARQAYDDEQEIIRTGKPMVGKPEKETHTDGRITWALTTKLPWRDKDGNIIGTFGISKDVTVIRETEEKLAYERELFHALVDNVPDAIYFKDAESRLVRLSRSKIERSRQVLLRRYREANPSADTEMLPVHLTDTDKCGEFLIGKTDFEVYVEDRARSSYNEEREIIRTGQPLLGKVEQSRQGDGKSSWFLTTKMPWRDRNGEVIGTFGISRDITSLKEAESKLESVHKQLLETSRLAGMAEVATDVLHNVGNVLNSVNVSCSLTIDRVKSSKIASLAKVVSLLEQNQAQLAEFLTKDPRGPQIPGYLRALVEHFSGEQTALLKELEQLLKHIDHIKQIVSMQQSYAKVAGVTEAISPAQLVEDALHINAAALTRHEVQVQREFEDLPPVQTEKHKVLQILVNLIRNAKYAMDEAKRSDKLLRIKVGSDNGSAKIQVIDNGVGIPQENLTRIFGHGFTTRKHGHGFGLHSSALAVKELGGSLVAHSDGPGTGATFTLLLPYTHPSELKEQKQ